LNPLIETEESELAAAANMNLGAYNVISGDVPKGLEFLRKAVELDPEDGEIRFNLAATFAGMGKHEDAIREFEAAEERGVEKAREIIEKIKAGIAENAKDPEKDKE
jgi:tetratricopeptide (TPR) repeat protein